MAKRHSSRVDLGTHAILLAGTNTTAGNSQLSAVATPILEVIIQADPANANDVRVGNGVAIPYVLTAGRSVTIAINSLQRVYVAIVAGDQVNWLALSD